MCIRDREMSEKQSNRAALRMILKRVNDGVSIGMTGDGPLGPALAVKDAPLDWARATGLPVFCYAFSTTRGRRLASWDRMLVPHPFGKGAYVFRRFEGTVPRKPDADTRDALRAQFGDWMNETTQRADALVGLPHGL